jgi:hypothetical protein
MQFHLNSRKGFIAAVGMLASGLAILSSISSEFSGTAEFESNTAAIVPAALLPFFVVGLVLSAVGTVELFASVNH